MTSTRRTARRLLPRPTLAQRGVVALVAALCALIVVGAAGGSAWLRLTADDLAAAVFEDAAYPARQVQVFYTAVSEPAVPHDAAATLEAALPSSLRAVLKPPRAAVATSESVMTVLPKAPTESPSYVSVAGIPDVEPLVEIVQGRFPRAGSPTEQVPAEIRRRPTPVVEVALERSAAEAMHTPVGSYLDLAPLRYTGPELERTPILRVSGIFEARASYPAPLDDVDNLRRPAISTLPEFTLVRATALAADTATVLEAPWGPEPELRWTFDPDGAPTAAEAAAVEGDARRLAVQPWPAVVESASSAAATGIGDLASGFETQHRSSSTLAALVLAALAAAALALLLAAASVLEGQRREVTDVLWARGAGTGQLFTARAGEAALMTAPGVLAVLGLVALTPAGTRDGLVGVAAAVACVVVLAVAQVAPWRQVPERVRVPARDALQIAAVLLAVGLGALLWSRSELDASDPLLLLLPALVGTAGAVLVVRGVRALTALLRRLAARGRRVSPLVAASQAGTSAEHVMLPVVALVLAACSGLLAVSVADTVDRGADAAAWREVGADVLVTGGQFDAALVRRVEGVPGVESVAPLHTVDSLVATRTGPEHALVMAVEPERLAAVTERSPQPLAIAAGEGGRLPVVVSDALDIETAETTVSYAQTTVPAVIVDRAEVVAERATEGPFVLVDVAGFRAAMDRRLLRAQVLLVAGDPDPAALREVVHGGWPSAKVHTRAAVTAEALADPVAARTLRVATAAVLASGLLGLLAAGLAVTRGRPLRARTLAVLHSLGAAPRQARWVASVELVPAMVAAGMVAIGCGLALNEVAGTGVDLETFADGATELSLRPDPVTWVVAAALLAGLVALVATASGWQVRRGADTPRADRRGSR